MNLDLDKIDDDVLALLYLTSFREHPELPWHAWKGHEWDTLDRLFQKGLIGDPKGKTKSIVFSREGYKRAKALFAAKYEKRAN